MGIFNEQSANQHPFAKGIQGAPGVGFNLTSDGDYDMVKKKLTNVADGTDPSDAVTKKQLNSVGSGDVTKNIDLKNQYNILNSKTRTFQQLKANDESLVNFAEVKENFIGTREAEAMQTHLDMGTNFIFNVKTPKNNDQAANKGYVDKEITHLETASDMTYARKMESGDYLKIDGSVLMIGNFNMNSKRIFNLPLPNGANQRSTKVYADNNFLNLNGNSRMGGDLIMDNHKITNLNPPTSTKTLQTKSVWMIIK